MAAFVFKLATLTIKTISKPFATRVQNFVLSHPTLRPAFISFAQVGTGSTGGTTTPHSKEFGSRMASYRQCTTVWSNLAVCTEPGGCVSCEAHAGAAQA